MGYGLKGVFFLTIAAVGTYLIYESSRHGVLTYSPMFTTADSALAKEMYPACNGRCVETENSTPEVTVVSDLGNDNSLSSKILYLLQTEECLPRHLRVALGNSSACQCDVVVLSYGRMCNDTSLSHVKYLFNSTTTWTTGRNLLFYTNIHNKSDRYLYYILMDDDIQVKWRKQWKKMLRFKNPWRSFEEFLRRSLPAVASLQINEKRLTKIEEIKKSMRCTLGSEYFSAVWYDAAFNAFHYQTVEYLFPYLDNFDDSSWWYSQVYFAIWTKIVFPGQAVVHRRLIAFNPKHRPYPRRTKSESPVLSIIKKMIRERLPQKCQSAHIAAEKHVYQSSQSSPYCDPPPLPNQTIVPFRNFEC